MANQQNQQTKNNLNSHTKQKSTIAYQIPEKPQKTQKVAIEKKKYKIEMNVFLEKTLIIF